MNRFFKTAFVLASFLLILGCGGNSPKSVAQKWQKAILAEDLKTANELSTEKTKALNALLISFTSNKSNEDAQKFGKATFDVETINGDKAVVTDSKSEDNYKIELIKKDGKWLVDISK